VTTGVPALIAKRQYGHVRPASPEPAGRPLDAGGAFVIRHPPVTLPTPLSILAERELQPYPRSSGGG
jgi:hypothetical protein